MSDYNLQSVSSQSKNMPNLFSLNQRNPVDANNDDKIKIILKSYNNYAEKYTFFDSNKSYQEFIKRKFGGLKDKYFTLEKGFE